MTALAAQSTTALTPALPRVGIVAVTLPADSEPLRSIWLDTDTLMVGYDPARLTRSLVALILHEQIGAFEDIGAEVTQ